MATTTHLRETLILLLLLAFCPLAAMANTNQPVSIIGANLQPTAAGGGNSFLPVISTDGRYVLFASSANNLAINTNGTPFVPTSTLALNVYLHDRTLGTNILISINAGGTGGGNDDSIPVAISTNGQFVLFESSASNLVPGDTNGAMDVFLRDVVNDITKIVSINTNGMSGNVASHNSAMTPDGRYVTFSSAASDLVAGDTNQINDVFVRDMQTGITTLASPGARSTIAATPWLTTGSDFPRITPDGRYVAFYSSATNLVPGVPTSGEIYVRDLTLNMTIDASISARTNASIGLGTTNVISYNQSISDDGQYVAYETSALTGSNVRAIVARYSLSSGVTTVVTANGFASSSTSEYFLLPTMGQHLYMTPDGRFLAFVGNLVNGTTNYNYIYVWDGQSNLLTLATRDTNNAAPSSSTADFPVLDSTGRYVAFVCNVTNLTVNAPAGFHIYVRDLLNVTNILVDADTNGFGSQTNLFCAPEMSADGRFVAFESLDSQFAPGDNNTAHDVFVRDLIARTTEMVSSRVASLPSMVSDGLSRMLPNSISADSRYVAFMSDADNLAAGDTNGYRDVYVHDMLVGTNILVSVNSNGISSGNGMSFDPVISGNGRFVAFTSSASNLVSGDVNNVQDVFVRDLQLGTTVLVSVSTNSANGGNGASFGPLISSDGRYVVFHSAANNIASFTANTNENVFLRDLQAGVTTVLSTNTATTASYLVSMSVNGRYVVLGGGSLPVVVWDTQAPAVIYTNTNFVSAISLSADGTWLATATTGSNGQIFAVNLATSSNVFVAAAPATSHQNPRFSRDDRYLTYVSAGAAGTNQVWYFDFLTGSNFLVSAAFNSSLGAYGNSDSPDISADGRFISYRSYGPNIVPGDTNNAPDVFLYDRVNNATTLVSLSRNGNTTASERSLAPVFSPDSRTLFFESWAGDIVPSDFNQNGDLFSLGLYTASSTAPFSLAMTPPAPGNLPVMTWPITPGANYQIQFKNVLGDPIWQPLVGNITFVGNEAFATDLAPGIGQRFYRVVAF